MTVQKLEKNLQVCIGTAKNTFNLTVLLSELKGESQKFLGKPFTLGAYMQNMWEKWDVEMKKLNFFNGILAIKGAEATVYFQRITRI